MATSKGKDQNIQCSSDMSEPKYTRNTRHPNTLIRVCIYANTRMHIREYMYVSSFVRLIADLSQIFYIIREGHRLFVFHHTVQRNSRDLCSTTCDFLQNLQCLKRWNSAFEEDMPWKPAIKNERSQQSDHVATHELHYFLA